MSASAPYRIGYIQRPRSGNTFPALRIITAAVFLTCAAAWGYPVTVTDTSGRSVRAETDPRRIRSLSPAILELLFAGRAGGQTPARTDFCTWPPEASRLPSVGGFDGKTFSLEKILSFRPDLVFLSAGMHDHLIQPLEKYGIPVYVSRTDTVGDIYTDITAAAALTGHAEEGKQTAAAVRGTVCDVQNTVAQSVPPAQRKTVYWEIWNSPYMTAGSGSFINSVIEAAGGINIFADIKQMYPAVSAESIIKRDPDVILVPSDAPAADFGSRPGWKAIHAVRDGRIYRIDADTVSRPGPRIPEAVRMLSAILYPELFD